MERYFNTAGPIVPREHYNVDPLHRLALDELLSLIRQNKYFVLHAPRQTGKTSLLFALMDYLNKEGKYKSLYVNLESGQAARGDAEKGIKMLLAGFAQAAEIYLKDSFIGENWEAIYAKNSFGMALNATLVQWCRQSDKPVVLLLDEVDSLVGDTLISVLRQLRSGYTHRPALFPQSVILCGVRDVRDYRIHSDSEKEIITGGSAFNIKAASLRMGNFDNDEIKLLFQQHTTEAGQPFHKDVFPLVWELTEGQPWLVNALAYEACFNLPEGRDRETEISADMILKAKENLILRRETHLDQLTDKLKEQRVRDVIEPILAGSDNIGNIPQDSIEYVEDLGLIKRVPQLAIANGIYQEIIPRALTYSAQAQITHDGSWYVDTDGRLDMIKLLTAFQDFFRKNIEHWEQGMDYKEAGPQLLLQAFLQRIVNGGGRVDREYGLGRMRTDLLVTWPLKKGNSKGSSKENQKGNQKGKQEVVMEIKIRYGSLENTIEKGLEQTRAYMDKCGTTEGYLLICDRTPDTTWEKKIFQLDKTYKDVNIKVFGL